LANINSVITYNANLSAAQAQIKALTGQIAGLTAAFNSLDKSALKAQNSLSATFAAGVGQVGGFTTKAIQANTAVENFGKAVAANRLTMRQYFREAIVGYTKQNSLMRQLAVQQVRFQQSIAVPTGPGQAMLLTPSAINKVASASQLAAQRFAIFNQLIAAGSERLLNFGKNTQWAGRQLMVGFTIPMTIFGVLVSKVFRDLDKELTRFEKVYGEDVGNTVEETTKKMRAQVQALAFEMSRSFGIASSETAALAADFAQTGKEGKDLLDAVRLTTKLAVLGDLERQQAMKATLSIQSAFKQNTEELAGSIDFLNAVENQTIASINDLTEAIPRVGPVIQALGGDVKDLSVLLVAMREGGVSAAEGANALKSSLGRIINPTKRAVQVASEFGVNLTEIVQGNRGQLMPMILELQQAMKGLDSFARAQIVEQVFGKFQFARMFALFENLGRQGSQTQQVIDLASKSTAELAAIANKELRILQESSAMRFTRAMEEIKNSLIPIGEVMTETLIPIFKTISGGINAFTSFFQKLPDPVKNFSKYVLLIAALAGPVVMIIGLFGNLIAQGIKTSMVFVNLAARIAGIRTEKFQLLNSDVMAAKIGVDNLTISFTTQETAMKRLVGVMTAYEQSLRRLTTINPALFIPGALPARGGAGVTPPIRRQMGSRRPERVPGGYGGGDRIPALLEPGEFVMTKEAVRKYAPVLTKMNQGRLPGFVDGLDERYLGSPGSYSRPKEMRNIYTPEIKFDVSSRMSILLDEMIADGRLPATLTQRQRNEILSPSIAHLRSEYEGDLKVWRQSNLILAPQAENQGLEQLFGKGKVNQRPVMISAIIARYGDSPEFREIFGAPIRGEGSIRIHDGRSVPRYDIDPNNTRHPSTPSQIRYMSRVLSEFFAPGAPRLSLSDKTLRIWGPVTAAVLNEKAAALEGRKIGGRTPLFGLPTPLSQQRTPQPLGPLSSPWTPRTSSPPPPSMTRPTGPGPRPTVMTPRGPLGVMPRELLVPPGLYADNGAMIGRNGSVQPLPRMSVEQMTSSIRQGVAARGLPVGVTGPMSSFPRDAIASTGPGANMQAGAMRGMGLMNLAFAASMVTSSMAMAGGASNDLAIKLGVLSSAVMGAAAMMQMFSGKNVMGNFLGLGTLGSKMTAAGTAAKTASGGAAGAGLLKGGAALSMLGGPVGIGVAAAATAGVAGYMMYMKAAEEARKRSVAAFEDPTKAAEYFGVEIRNITQEMKDLQTGIPEEELSDVDQGIRDAVKEDYSDLIEKIRYSGAEAGARELSLVFNKMLVSGLSKESAISAVKAIAVEAGQAGGQAFSIAYRSKMLEADTTQDIVKNLAAAFDPELMAKNVEAIEKTVDSIDRGPLADSFGNIAELFDNPVGDIAASLVGIQLPALAMNVLAPDDPSTQFFNPDKLKRNIDEAAEYSRTMEQLAENIKENMDVSSTQIVGIVETLFSTFKDAPVETMQAFDQIKNVATSFDNVDFDPGPIQDFLATLDPIAATNLSPLIEDNEELAYQILQGVTAGMSLQEIVESLQEGTFEVDVQVRVRRAQLDNLINDLKSGVYGSIAADFERQIGDSEDSLLSLDKQIKRVQRSIENGTQKRQESFEAEREASEAAIEGLQKQTDAIQKVIDKRREEYEEKTKQLEEEKNNIKEAADLYIKSLQKRQKADSFYSNQRKTAFGALEKLASGDVFGFLQEREQMSSDAQQFSYDKTIEGIEEKRDLEIKSIDDVLEKEKKKQEQFEKNKTAQLNGIRDQINAERDLMKERQKAHEENLKTFQETKQKRIEDLTDAKEREQGKRRDLQEIKDRADRKEIISAQTLQKFLGPELAAPYIQKQKEIIKTIYIAEREKEIAEGLTDDTRSLGLVRNLFDILFGNKDQGSLTNDALRRWLSKQSSQPTTTPPPPQERAQGGYIRGPGGPRDDKIPARLSNGEYVIKASSVSKYGKPMMDSINSGKFANGGLIQGFARGGLVSKSKKDREIVPVDPIEIVPIEIFPVPEKNSGIQRKIDRVKKAYKDGKINKKQLDKLVDFVIRKSFGKNDLNRENTFKFRSLFNYFKNKKSGTDPIKIVPEDPIKIVPVEKFAKGGPVEMKKALDKWAGPKLKYHGGWSSAGSWGEPYPAGIMMHHTSAPATDAQVDAMKNGWGGIKGPIVQSVISRDGTGHIIGYGNRNVGAGPGTTKYMGGEATRQGPQKDLRLMKGILDAAGGANPALFQMEVISEGLKQDFTSAQFDTVAKISSGLREWMGWPTFSGRIINHKDWAGYRTDGKAKADTLYPRSVFENNANKAWTDGAGAAGDSRGKNNNAGENKRTSGFNPLELKAGEFKGAGEGRLGKALPKFLERPDLLSGQTISPTKTDNSRPGRDITLNPSDYEDEFIKGYKLVKLIYGSGWKNKDDIRTAYGVVMGESSGKRTASNDNWVKGGKGIDWGLWQINDYWHKEVGGEKIDFSKSRIFDAIYNSKIAHAMWKDPKNHGGSTQTPWGGWDVHPVTGKFPGGSDGYRRGINEFDNNPNWWRQLITETGGSPGSGDSGGAGTDASLAIRYAMSQRGKPYSLNARPPDSWDCSKLTAWAYNVGVPNGKNKYGLTAYSHAQGNELRKRVVGLKSGKISGLVPGDILYLSSEFADSGGHTSLYIGGNQIVEAGSPVKTNPLNNGWNNGINPKTGKPRFFWAGPPKARFASGGFISGPGGPRSDMIPAMLSNGEYVVKASSVAKYGKGFMDRLNSGQLNPQAGPSFKFADGGMVGSAPQMPAFNMPQMSSPSLGVTSNNYNGGSMSNNNKTNVKVVINGAGGKSANAIANKVISMINASSKRRDHSRSLS